MSPVTIDIMDLTVALNDVLFTVITFILHHFHCHMLVEDFSTLNYCIAWRF